MTFTYASTSTSVTDLSWIRLRLFDTSSATAKLTDEEIGNFISVYTNRYLAAAAAAETLGAKYSGFSDKTVGKLSISQGSLGDRYMKLAATLRREASLFATPYAGGISQDDKNSEEADSDRVKPGFYVGQFEDVAVSDASTAVF